MSKLKSFIFIILIIAVLGGCFYEIKINNNSDSEKFEDLKTLQTQIDDLQKQKRTVEQRIEEIEQIIATASEEAEETPVPSVMFCFEGITDRLYDELAPVLDEAGIQGAMVFKAGTYPGDGTHISVAHAAELVEKGWSIAISSGNVVMPSDSEESDSNRLKRYLNDYIGIMTDLGFSIDSVYFNPDTYQDTYQDTLADLDIKNVFVNDDISFDTAGTLDFIRVTDLMNPELIVNQYASESYICIKFEVDEDSDNYSDENLTAIVNGMLEMQNREACMVTSPANMHINETEQYSSSDLEAYTAELESLQQQYEELKTEIKDLYKD